MKVKYLFWIFKLMLIKIIVDYWLIKNNVNIMMKIFFINFEKKVEYIYGLIC